MLNSFFKRKISIPKHQENWQVYFSRINNQQTSVIVDLNIAKIAPVKVLPEVFYLIIPFDFANDNGLPSLESYKMIKKIEDEIAELNHRFAENLLHVATLTMNSERLQMYYCSKVDDSKVFLAQIDKAFNHQLTYQIDHRADPEWNDYFNLAYPLPFQLEMIKNRVVLRKLTEAGDNLVKSRKVNHYLVFNAEKDADHFMEFAENERFVLFLMEKRGDQWKLGISRNDYVSYEQIDELCLPLWEKAQVYNGTYNGWESEVILSQG